MKRFLSLVLALCMVFTLLPVMTLAATTQEGEKEPGDFASFAELKELAARTDLTEVLVCTYVGSEPLVIEEDLTLPWFLGVKCTEQPVIIPEGVTLTVENQLDLSELTVNGMLNVAALWVYSALTINGTLNNNLVIALNSKDVVLNGEENIHYGEETYLAVCYEVNTLEELKALVAEAEENSDPNYLYEVDVCSDLTIDESLTLPENFNLATTYDMTVEEGCTLTVNRSLCIQGNVLVEGTLCNNDWISIYTHRKDASLTIAEVGSYTGDGMFDGVTPGGGPETVIFGLDLSAFDQDYDEETGYWYLYHIPEKGLGDFTSFAELKELAARTDLTEVLPITYVGTEPLVIEEDLTLPWFLGVACMEQPMIVPEGVTLTAENLMQVNELTVEGSMDVVAIEISKSLTVKGTMNASVQVLLSNQNVTLEGEENIVFEDDAVLCLCRVVTTLDELIYALRLATEYEGTGRVYCIQIEGNMTINKRLPMPSNVQIAIRANVTLAEGFALENGDSWPTLIHGTFIVNGTLNNAAGIYIVHSEDFAGKLVVTEGGTYTGEGKIMVYNTLSDDPADAISGIDLSGFDKSYDENSGIWTLTPGAAPALGDVDGSESIDFFDGMYILQYYAGVIDETQLNVSAADVDSNGSVDFFDGMYILQYYAGVIDKLPVET